MTRTTKEDRLKHEILKKIEDLISDMNWNVDAVVVEGFRE